MPSVLTCPLDWRYRVSKAKVEGKAPQDVGCGNVDLKDRTVRELVAFYKATHLPKYENYNIIFEIYSNKLYKCNIEAMLLAGCTHEECEDYFGVPVSAIGLYQDVFYDVSIIRHSKARIMNEALTSSLIEHDMKMCAAKFGKEVVLNLIGMSQSINDADVVKRIKNGILIKTLGHEFVDSNSPEMGGYLKMMSQVIPKPGADVDVSVQMGDELTKAYAKFFVTEQ